MGARPHLQAAVHHADNEVKLLVVQDCPVLLHVQVQLLREAAACRAPLQGPQHSWQQLGTGEHGAGGIQPCPGRRGEAQGQSPGGEGSGPREARAQALSTEETWKRSRSGVPRLCEFTAPQRRRRCTSTARVQPLGPEPQHAPAPMSAAPRWPGPQCPKSVSLMQSWWPAGHRAGHRKGCVLVLLLLFIVKPLGALQAPPRRPCSRDAIWLL